jgi:hypothetical protein
MFNHISIQKNAKKKELNSEYNLDYSESDSFLHFRNSIWEIARDPAKAYFSHSFSLLFFKH